MGYSFASHFSPAPAAPAFNTYRDAFRPSAQFARPHAILGVAVVCAESEEEADLLATTMDLAWLRIRRGEFLPLPSPEDARAYPYTQNERFAVEEYRSRTVIGTPASVKAQIVRKAFRGADFLYTLRLGTGETVMAHVPSHHDHKVGEWIGIRAQVDHVVTFERGSPAPALPMARAA